MLSVIILNDIRTVRGDVTHWTEGCRMAFRVVREAAASPGGRLRMSPGAKFRF